MQRGKLYQQIVRYLSYWPPIFFFAFAASQLPLDRRATVVTFLEGVEGEGKRRMRKRDHPLLVQRDIMVVFSVRQ